MTVKRLFWVITNFIFCFLFISYSCSQTIIPQIMEEYEKTDVKYNIDSNTVFLDPYNDAQFPGGTIELRRFIKENLVYPSSTRVSGIVYASFIIEISGELRDPKIVRGIGEEFDSAVLDLITKMPNWIPGYIGDDPVRTKVIVPFRFELS